MRSGILFSYYDNKLSGIFKAMYIAKQAIKVIRIDSIMPKTKHYQSRIQQRGIKESTIKLAQELGQVYGDKFILGKKEIQHELKNIRKREKNLLKALDQGGIVVVQAEGVLVTAYQIDSPLRFFKQ